MEITNFPREQDDFKGTDERYYHFLFHFIYFFFLKKIVVHVTLLISSNFHVRTTCTDVQSTAYNPLTYVRRKKREIES